MFRCNPKNRLGGFTLIELTIVLGVVGILAAGLWRLMSTGTQQTKDVATAQQQIALINAVQGYLSDTTANGGQPWLLVLGNGGPATTLPLPLGCPNGGNTAQQALFCSYLPSGFTVNTTNPYGQTYRIQVLPGTVNAQQNYSFMIVASGAVIPDPDGGRISALIGGSGGFIYTSNVCGVPANRACGTMGAWNVANVVAGYGFAVSASNYAGSVASLSFVSSAANNNYNWLARVRMPNDPTFLYNTMTLANFYLGGGTNSLNFGVSSNLNAPNTVMDVGGGTINLVGGNLNTTPGGKINVDAAGTITLNPDPNGLASQIIGISAGQTGAGSGLGGGRIQLSGDMTNNPATSANALFRVVDACVGPTAANAGNCAAAVNFNANVGITGMLNANVFIYSPSDKRLKKDIEPLPDDTLSNIMKLDPVSFTYKSNNVKALGVIAQDLEKVYPLMVSTGSGPDGMKSVAYDNLIAPLIKSVQQLKKENDNLRASLNEQTAREDKMQQEIDQLRHK